MTFMSRSMIVRAFARDSGFVLLSVGIVRMDVSHGLALFFASSGAQWKD